MTAQSVDWHCRSVIASLIKNGMRSPCKNQILFDGTPQQCCCVTFFSSLSRRRPPPSFIAISSLSQVIRQSGQDLLNSQENHYTCPYNKNIQRCIVKKRPTKKVCPNPITRIRLDLCGLYVHTKKVILYHPLFPPSSCNTYRGQPAGNAKTMRVLTHSNGKELYGQQLEWTHSTKIFSIIFFIIIVNISFFNLC